MSNNFFREIYQASEVLLQDEKLKNLSIFLL